MNSITTHHVGDVAVDFHLPEVTGARFAYFVLGIRKSGSSIFNSIMQALASANQAPFVDVGGVFFEKNVRVREWINDQSLGAILRPGIVYGGFRDYPLGLSASPVFREGRKALMVRDPRDALVSEYFSNAYSHSLPTGDASSGAAALMLAHREAARQTAVEEYVRKQSAQLLRTLTPFVAVKPDPTLLVFRYEDVILDKPKLIRRVVDHFGWTCEEALLQNILSWADVRPEAENPTAFIRKVTPGDHKDKLSHATIAELNAMFAPFMERFGYV